MEHDRRRRTWEAGNGRDCISGLPDELLHGILRRLRSAAAAARTSVLSRRWRRVWASLPELVLDDDLIHHGASFLDAVDDVLAAYTTATAHHVHSLEIIMPRKKCQDVTGLRVASWLRFASRRLVGALRLRVSIPDFCQIDHNEPRSLALLEDDELELPPCERATSIELGLGTRFLLRLPPPARTFAALADLEIRLATVEVRALEALVSTQCPRLRKLSLAVTLVAASDVSLRSGTLQHLKFNVKGTVRLYVAAPALQVLEVQSPAADVYVAAPNLAEVVWGTWCTQFIFADAGSHLRRLEVQRRDAMAPLMRRFNSVDELRLLVQYCPMTGEEWKTFLDDTNYILFKCQTLHVTSVGDLGENHGFVATVLHLLRRGKGIRKLHVLYAAYPREVCSSASLSRLPESSMTDNIMLDSLEEIDISLMGGSTDQFVKFLKQLLFNIWSNTKLKCVETIMWHPDPLLISEVCKKIHATCPSNIRIKLNVYPGEDRATFETSPI